MQVGEIGVSLPKRGDRISEEVTASFSGVAALVDGLSDRFYEFVSKTFPAFQQETTKQLASLNTQMQAVNARLKKIEDGRNGSSGGNSRRLSFIPPRYVSFARFIPWIITALLAGAAITGYIFGGGGLFDGSTIQNAPKLGSPLESPKKSHRTQENPRSTWEEVLPDPGSERSEIPGL